MELHLDPTGSPCSIWGASNVQPPGYFVPSLLLVPPQLFAWWCCPQMAQPCLYLHESDVQRLRFHRLQTSSVFALLGRKRLVEGPVDKQLEDEPPLMMTW